MSSVLASVDQRTQLVGQNRLELLLFTLGEHGLFGINVFKVREVLTCPELTVLPKSHPCVRGVAHLRNETISVIDLNQAIGNAPLENISDCFVIITEFCNRVQGFLVNSVIRIVNLNWNDIHLPPEATGKDNYLVAITDIEDALVGILDVERILSELMPSAVMDFEDEDCHLVPIFEEHRDKKVLIADDSLIARKQIDQTLGRMGLETNIFTNGKAVYDHLKTLIEQGQNPIDQYCMFICDIEMPEMDGYTLVSKIRDEFGMKDFTIMMYTSLSGNFNRSMVQSVGADDFLSKFCSQQLNDKIRQHLGELPPPDEDT